MGRVIRRLVRFALYGLAGLLVLAAVAITFTVGWRPVIGPKARALNGRSFEATPARLARGEYLVNAVAGCYGCHSQYDMKAEGEPKRTSRPGAGTVFINSGKFRVVASNITPDRETGIGGWTDDALARAIREGVDPKGRALFPIMPYGGLREMSDEDLASVIVYLRSQPAVRNPLPDTHIPFPVSRLINAAPQPVESVPHPDLSDAVKRGRYLVTIADCAGCHTPKNQMGQPVPGLELAGGMTMEGAAAANITPDASGISYYDEALFLQAMKTGHVKARKLSPVMPWWFYRSMTDDDLKSVFAYLETLKPARHRVDNTEPVSKCKVCQLEHAGGALN